MHEAPAWGRGAYEAEILERWELRNFTLKREPGSASHWADNWLFSMSMEQEALNC